MDPLYLKIAAEHEVRLCASCRSVSNHKHQLGWVAGGRLHWRARRHHRIGLAVFLKLVYQLRYEDRRLPEWLRLYQRNRWAYHYARNHLYRTLPRRASDLDKAAVAYHLQKAEPVPAILERAAQRVRRWVLR